MSRNLRSVGRRVSAAALAMLILMLLDIYRWESVDPMMLGWIPYGFWWPVMVTALAGPVLHYFFRHYWQDVPVSTILQVAEEPPDISTPSPSKSAPESPRSLRTEGSPTQAAFEGDHGA